MEKYQLNALQSAQVHDAQVAAKQMAGEATVNAQQAKQAQQAQEALEQQLHQQLDATAALERQHADKAARLARMEGET